MIEGVTNVGIYDGHIINLINRGGILYLVSRDNGNALRTDYVTIDYLLETSGIKERCTVGNNTFLLSGTNEVYVLCDWFSPNDKDIVKPCILRNLDSFLLQDISIIKIINAQIYRKCMAKSWALFNVSDPSDISQLLAVIANKTNYDRWLLSRKVNSNFTSNRSTMAYVYFLRSTSGLIKIGCTTNLHERVRAIKAMCSEQLTLIGTIQSENQYLIEKELHDYFKSNREHGEWFHLTRDDIINAVSDKYELILVNQ